MSALPWVYHPLTLVVAQVCHTALIIGFTSPSSLLRKATFPFQFWIVWLAITTALKGGYNSTYTYALPAGQLAVCLLDYFDRALLQKWAYTAQGPVRTFDDDQEKRRTSEQTKVRGLSGSVWDRLTFGLKVAISRRHPDTPYEVKNCPHFSSKDKSYVPSRNKFVFSSLFAVLASYAFIDLTDANAQSNKDASLFGQDKVPFFTRLGDVTGQEVALRFMVAAISWTTTYCFITTWNLFSLLAVSLRLTDVKSWRPWFGSFSDLYSIRKFWGVFWHQLLRNNLNDPATVVTHDILRLPAKGLVPRYTKLVISFFISGVVHLVTDILICGLTYEESHAIRFFVTQAFGIMVEDGVQELWRRSFGGGQAGAETERWKKVVGFIWVWSFMAWTIPSWFWALAAKRAVSVEPPIMGALSISSWYMSRS